MFENNKTSFVNAEKVVKEPKKPIISYEWANQDLYLRNLKLKKSQLKNNQLSLQLMFLKEILRKLFLKEMSLEGILKLLQKKLQLQLKDKS